MEMLYLGFKGIESGILHSGYCLYSKKLAKIKKE